jgi:hypothetical protein
MNTYEQIALWYLRLNGYFTMPNFIAHGDGGPRTDVDVLGLRLPYSREYPDDTDRLQTVPHKVDVVLAEAKKGRCKLNGPWKPRGNRHALEYVLRRVGAFESDSSVSEVATELYARQRYEDGSCLVRIVCFGSKMNGRLGGVTQILWCDALSFINQRFRTYRDQKVEHQHWDSFGQYLWERLTRDDVPGVEEMVRGCQVR